MESGRDCPRTGRVCAYDTATLGHCARLALCGNEDPAQEITSKSADRFTGRTAHCSICENQDFHRMPENRNPEDDLFEAALLRSPGPERAAYLDGECRGDRELRARV